MCVKRKQIRTANRRSTAINFSFFKNKQVKATAWLIGFSILLFSCGAKIKNSETSTTANPIIGTWQLLSGTLIEKGDTTVTDYTKNLSFIKIINDTHFAFLQHDKSKGKDSAAVFVAGGGRYSLSGNSYTEHLEYCSAREREDHDFQFTIRLNGDTLTQEGIEKVESAGVNRVNIEKYVRLKK
jgi:hypothetical protein